VNCREVQEEIAVGLLTGADRDEPTDQHIATCPACAAEEASLRQVRSLRGSPR
jgi:anti-sigma factor RsiW